MRPYETFANDDGGTSPGTDSGANRANLPLGVSSVAGTLRQIMVSPHPSGYGASAVRPSTTMRAAPAGGAARGPGSTAPPALGSRALPTTPFKEFSDRFDEAFFLQSFGRSQNSNAAAVAVPSYPAQGTGGSPTRRRSSSGPPELEARATRPSTGIPPNADRSDSNSSRISIFADNGTVNSSLNSVTSESLPLAIPTRASQPSNNASGNSGRTSRRVSTQISRMRFLPVTSPTSSSINGGAPGSSISQSPSLFGSRSLNSSSPIDDSTSSTVSATSLSAINTSTSDELPRLGHDTSLASYDVASADLTSRPPRPLDTASTTLPRTTSWSPLFLDGDTGPNILSPARNKLLTPSPQSVSRTSTNHISEPSFILSAVSGTPEVGVKGRPPNVNMASKTISAATCGLEGGQHGETGGFPGAAAMLGSPAGATGSDLSSAPPSSVLTPKSILKRGGRRYGKKGKMSVRFHTIDTVHSIGDALDLAEARTDLAHTAGRSYPRPTSSGSAFQPLQQQMPQHQSPSITANPIGSPLANNGGNVNGFGSNLFASVRGSLAPGARVPSSRASTSTQSGSSSGSDTNNTGLPSSVTSSAVASLGSGHRDLHRSQSSNN